MERFKTIIIVILLIAGVLQYGCYRFNMALSANEMDVKQTEWKTTRLKDSTELMEAKAVIVKTEAGKKAALSELDFLKKENVKLRASRINSSGSITTTIGGTEIQIKYVDTGSYRIVYKDTLIPVRTKFKDSTAFWDIRGTVLANGVLLSAKYFNKQEFVISDKHSWFMKNQQLTVNNSNPNVVTTGATYYVYKQKPKGWVRVLEGILVFGTGYYIAKKL
jgi:hypothetical protein